MRVPRLGGIVRVTNSREEIEEATRLAIEKRRENYSPEALVLAVDDVVQNLPLSRAIVVYVQNAAILESDPSLEKPFSWFSVFVSAGFAASCLWLAIDLFGMVRPSTEVWGAFLIVLGQGLLLRFGHRALRLAVMAACDGLNNASYPTKLHPFRTASSAMGTMRLRRLRALVVETADRIIAGESPKKLREELSEINLTSQAAPWVVALAQLNASVRDFLPPYQSRLLAYGLAFAFFVTAAICVGRAGDRLAEGFQLYAIAVAAWISGELSARPRLRRPPPERKDSDSDPEG